ncbi:SDR family NAD(P)-dependent oxidoreductase [Maritalea mediterranea]|uniref:SDR family NAD(P)-dependent oxidoreductase n=1 Tax=Maritalea mediterranea TaxID=2909667 RepID=A0ABS9E932_9HYPH|nr:SDR family NAD(P)-dependent oxidoreductase [Maritalea mediterranea]MCF4098265.1 SDR family NAD(P)-dependent oxidoreductase [Maritalea mediterranea]
MLDQVEEINAIIVGANGGIGQALKQNLANRPNVKSIESFDREHYPHFDITDPESFSPTFAGWQQEGRKFNLAIIATGALIIDGAPPERRFAELGAQNMANHFALNAIGPAMMIQQLLPLMPRDEPAVIAALTARVGSIEDNHLGGWVSYRAAKTALNQIVRTASIEWTRKNQESALLAIHPGTVDTRLTQDYAHPKKVSAGIAADKIINCIYNAKPPMSGGFYDNQGKRIPF